MVGERAIVLQELIPGGGSSQFSYAAVWHRGSPVASLVARRSRQYPIDFGYTSTYVETMEQKDVEEAACGFLKSIDYSGLVEVEFKRDHRDGRCGAWPWARPSRRSAATPASPGCTARVTSWLPVWG
jgi:predicted ATP-grasp superfamily ATP-dependent carboligase